MGKLEVGELIAVGDGDGGGDNDVAEVAEDSEAESVEEVMDLTGRESDAEDVGEFVGGDKAIEHLEKVHKEHFGMNLVDKAFVFLVLVMTGEDSHWAIHEAGSRDVDLVVGCMDSLADEKGNMKVDSKSSKHVQCMTRD